MPTIISFGNSGAGGTTDFLVDNSALSSLKSIVNNNSSFKPKRYDSFNDFPATGDENNLYIVEKAGEEDELYFWDIDDSQYVKSGSSVGSNDEEFFIVDDQDDTKKIKFSADRISSGETRVIKMPDSDIDLGFIQKLLPAQPPNLSEKTLTLSTSYSALESGTGNSVDNITDNAQPDSNVVENFYDGDDGILSVEIDGFSVEKTLSTASDVVAQGPYDALVILADEDPYDGIFGKAGFYKQLDAQIQPTNPLSLGQHTYQLIHSKTGSTNLLTFQIENPPSPTVSALSTQTINDNTIYISGVPSLSANDSIVLSIGLNGIAGDFYNSTIGRILSPNGSFNQVNINPPGILNSGDTYSNTHSINVLNNKYMESIQVRANAYNSKGTLSPNSDIVIQSRVDTKSSESRVTSGTTDYPTSYGTAFNSSTSLKTGDYTHELQLLNALYQYPTGDYTTNTPVSGPDYSTGMGNTNGNWRFATFELNSITDASGLTVNINNASGFSGAETSNLKLYLRVDGANGTNGWIDANSSYPGTGSPTNDGDSAMDFANSDSDTKRITFGSTPRTGTVYVRLGIPSGDVKKFSSITLSNIT